MSTRDRNRVSYETDTEGNPNYNKPLYDPVTTTQKSNFLSYTQQNNKDYAVMWVNYHQGRHANEQKGHHFILAHRRENGMWYNYDHNRSYREKIKWDEVYGLNY
jgi:hypothetical protein